MERIDDYQKMCRGEELEAYLNEMNKRYPFNYLGLKVIPPIEQMFYVSDFKEGKENYNPEVNEAYSKPYSTATVVDMESKLDIALIIHELKLVHVYNKQFMTIADKLAKENGYKVDTSYIDAFKDASGLVDLLTINMTKKMDLIL